MKTETTLRDEYNLSQRYLYLAFELGQSEWKLGFTIGYGQKPRLRTIKARDVVALQDEMRAAKKRFGLPEDAPVLSCYEAGRDGFWLHRYLESNGIQNLIVDSSSIEVNRKSQTSQDRSTGCSQAVEDADALSLSW